MAKKRKKNDLVEQIEASSSRRRREKIRSYIPTGSTLFDLILGGGHPVGKIVNLVGDSCSGKTFLASECISEARKHLGKKLKWIFDDAEHRFTFKTNQLYGFDIIDDKFEASYTIEDFKSNLREELKRLKADETLIYVLDSFDAISSEAEVKRSKKQEDGTQEKGSYNLEKQKQLGEFFRLRAKEISEKKCLLVIISQVRANIGISFGPKYYRTGGKALDHWASSIVWLAEVEKKRKKGRAVGYTVKARVAKVGNDKPFRECYLDVLFDYGVDDVSSNLLYLYDLRTDLGREKEKLNERELKWDKKSMTLRKLIRHIEDNGLEDELKKRVTDKWNETEDSISSKGRKRKW